MTWHKTKDKLPKDNSLCVVILQESLGGTTVFTPEAILTVYNSKNWYPWRLRKGKVLYWKLITTPKDFTSDTIMIKDECIVLK